MVKATLEYSPELPLEIDMVDGDWAIIIGHGERTYAEKGILLALSKKLNKKNYSTIRFSFPFRVKGERAKSTSSLDEAFTAVFRYATSNYPEKRWVLCGHGIAAASALRIAPVASEYGELPPIIALNYPLYPPNRPDKVDMRALGAIIGEALFLQGTESNRGDTTRIRNSVRMMAEHVHIGSIGGANYKFEVKDKSEDTVAYWMANDIEKFLNDIF